MWNRYTHNSIQSERVPSYEVAFDVKGRQIHPGDYVSIKTYPRGTVRGIVTISKRAVSIDPRTKEAAPALTVVTDDGTVYSLPSSKAVRALKR